MADTIDNQVDFSFGIKCALSMQREELLKLSWHLRGYCGQA
jgi:hypothetical protein